MQNQNYEFIKSHNCVMIRTRCVVEEKSSENINLQSQEKKELRNVNIFSL